MRILLWSENFPPVIGGIERHLTMFLDEMTARGYQFMVITTRHFDATPAHELWHDIPIHRIDFAGTFNQGNITSWIRLQKQLTQLIRDFDPALYHVFGLGASILAFLQLYKQIALPMLVRLATTYIDPAREFGSNEIITKLLDKATWVTTVAQAVKDQAVTHRPSLSTRISVLYNGHPPPKLSPTPLATPPHALFLARLGEQKGCDLLIAAFAELHKRYPDMRLTIAGDGTERARLEQQAIGLGDAVEFIGWCPPHQVHALINTATMFVLPSRWEGLPNVAIEAAFMARPTVATDVSGTSEVVLDGQTGLLVPPEDVPALAAAMAYLVEHPAEARAMGEAAYAWAHKQFTITRCADEYEALYPKVVTRYHATQSAEA